jgi:hypothetical protein
MAAYLFIPQEKAMARSAQGERRQAVEPRETDTRGALWSLPDGGRLPNLVEAARVDLGDPSHPARLRPGDLDNPQRFHNRLAAWLLKQS